MVKKGEAEEAIRHLCHEWAKECGIPREPVDQPSFSAVTSWLAMRNNPHKPLQGSFPVKNFRTRSN